MFLGFARRATNYFRARATSERGDFLLAQGMFAAVTLSIVSLIGVSILQTGIELDSQTRVNGQVAKIIQTRATQVAQGGYTQVSTQAGVSTVSLSLDTASTATISARQSITLDAGGQSATVLVVAGKYANGQMTDSATCSLTLSNPTTSCVYATATAVTDVSTTVPVVDNFTPVNPGDNIPPSTRTRYISTSTGFTHSAALDSTGQVWAWGTNAAGELGDGTTVTRSSPVKAFVGKNIQKVYAGYNVTFAIDTAGNLWAVGMNNVGQLGIGDQVNRSTPVQVKPGTVFASASIGGWLSFAVDTTGNAWAWGWNAGGLGVASPTGTGQTTPIRTLVGKTITQINANINGGGAIDSAGGLWMWGVNNYGQIGNGTTTAQTAPVQVSPGTSWKAITLGDGTTCGLDTYRRAWCWGYNGWGQVGNGGTANQVSPVRVGGSTFFTSIDTGSGSTVAVDSTGQAWTWGLNDRGQLGVGDTTNRTTPTLLPTTARFLTVSVQQNVTGPASGWMTAVDTSHYMWTWGGNSFYGLGDGTAAGQRNTAARVDVTSTPIVQVVNSAGISTTAIDSAGRMWYWGNNWNGIAGNGSGGANQALAPTQVAPGQKWVRIFTANSAIFAVNDAGQTYGWGYNATNCNQVGVASTASFVTTPTLLNLPTTGGGPIQIVSNNGGADVSMYAVLPDGNLYAWGGNGVGQLGINDTSCRTTPVLSGTGIKKVVTGPYYRNAFALGYNNTLWATGENGYGTLGFGHLSNVYRWYQVGGSYVDVAAGERHTSAIGTDGQAYGWGRNIPGEWAAGGGYSFVVTGSSTDYNCVNYSMGTGCIDSMGVNSGNQVGVYGWVIDWTNTWASPDTHVYITPPGGSEFGINMGAANTYRPDVNNAFGVGGNHGISKNIPGMGLDREGTWQFKFYVITGGGNPTYAKINLNVIAAVLSPRAIGSAYGANQVTACGDNTITWNTNGGYVSGWGLDRYSELNTGGAWQSTYYPFFEPPAGPTQLVAQSFNPINGSCALFMKDSSGLVYSWGNGYSTALGRNFSGAGAITQIPGLTGVTSLVSSALPISGTQGYISAITSSGEVWQWGSNGNGQINGVPSGVIPTPRKAVIPLTSAWAALSGAQSTSTVWRLGSVGLSGQLANLQVNVKTAYPVSGIGLWCPTTGQKMVSAAAVLPGSGEWQFGNVMIADAKAAGTLGTCATDPYLAVYLEGEPLNPNEVSTLVYQVQVIQ